MSLRVGVAGVGALGRHHLRAAGRSRDAELVGAYDPHPERADLAREYGGRAFPTLDALIESCDALVVSSPTPTHRAVAGRALEAGRHALVEKPLAAGSNECDELIALASANRVILHVGHVERMNPAVRAAHALIREPRFIEVRRLASFTPRGADVDVLLDLMIHDLDLVLEWVGEEPESIAAVGVAVLTGREDIANARLEFPGGCVADLTASRVSQERLRKIRLFQPDAYLSLDCARGLAEMVEADRAAIAALLSAGALAGVASSAISSGAASMPPDWSAVVRRRTLPKSEGDPLELQLAAFAAATRGEPQGPGMAAADGPAGARAVRVAESLREALRRRALRWEN
jgi:predicted dehydrogenase